MKILKYYLQHCIPTGWQTIRGTFKIWCDLMRGNYSDYALLPNDCPFSECRDWFWWEINADNVYSFEFLEYLQELVRRVDAGEEELVDFPRLDERN